MSRAQTLSWGARRLGARAWLSAPPRVGVVLVVCSVTLALAYVQKDPAFLLRLHPSSFVGLASYSDIVGLYHPRLIDQGVFPYVHGYLHNGQPAGGAIEYPVLTGLFMWLAGTLTSGASEYFRFSVLLLFPLGLLIAFLLTRMAGWRVLLWAAAPALALYAFVNWELLVVAAAVAGLWLWWRGRAVWAGVAFGIGAAFKLFPILFLIPLAIERSAAGDARAAARTGAPGLGRARCGRNPRLPPDARPPLRRPGRCGRRCPARVSGRGAGGRRVARAAAPPRRRRARGAAHDRLRPPHALLP